MVAEVAWEAEEGAAAHTHHTLPHTQRGGTESSFGGKAASSFFVLTSFSCILVHRTIAEFVLHTRALP